MRSKLTRQANARTVCVVLFPRPGCTRRPIGLCQLCAPRSPPPYPWRSRTHPPRTCFTRACTRMHRPQASLFRRAVPCVPPPICGWLWCPAPTQVRSRHVQLKIGAQGELVCSPCDITPLQACTTVVAQPQSCVEQRIHRNKRAPPGSVNSPTQAKRHPYLSARPVRASHKQLAPSPPKCAHRKVCSSKREDGVS